MANSSGELTFKQGGFMLLVIGAGLVGAERITDKHWLWKGLPVIDIGYVFVALGAILALYGIAKKV